MPDEVEQATRGKNPKVSVGAVMGKRPRKQTGPPPFQYHYTTFLSDLQ